MAQTPLPERHAGRMLVLDPARRQWSDRQVMELPECLLPGDLLVFNDTKVLPARLSARKETGGAVELLLDRLVTSTEGWFLARSSKPLRSGMAVLLPGGEKAYVSGKEEMRISLHLHGNSTWAAILETHGSVPLPPYIQHAPDDQDRERYQTVYARHPGAVAAPTAGLHFDGSLLARLNGSGIGSAFVTLHVGAGTFLPVRTENIDEHRMHAEVADVDAGTVSRILETRARGGRIFAVGTTACRALEAAGASGTLAPFQGETRLFLYPGKPFHVIDGLFTNFHLPESTLLMLVCALAGTEFTLAAYAHAVKERYRFFSYGDAMLILPPALPGRQQ